MNVIVLVVILYYSFLTCYDWGNWIKVHGIYIIFYNFIQIHNEVKIKGLFKNRPYNMKPLPLKVIMSLEIYSMESLLCIWLHCPQLVVSLVDSLSSVRHY